MDHDGRAVIVEEARIQHQLGVEHLDLQRARVRDMDVRHVADMHAAFGEEAVFVAARIEMSARRLEGRLALSDRMDMEGMRAGRQARKPGMQQRAVGGLDERDLANGLALRVGHRGPRPIRRTGGLEGGGGQRGARQQADEIHGLHWRLL